jgi:hypothetical protein
MKTIDKAGRVSLLLAGVSLAFTAGLSSAHANAADAPLYFADAGAATGMPLLQEGAPGTQSGTASIYASIAVTKPAEGSTVFNNAGNVDVTVAVSPALRADAGDQIVLLVDGHRAATQNATRFNLSGIVRGEHTLEAQVVDSSGNALISSKPVKFYMWQASRLFLNRRDK